MSISMKAALIAVGVFLLLGSHAFANAHWKRCIRMSFPGTNQGTMTNLCNKNLYAIWYDDHGEHSTAIGSSRSLGLGTIYGRFQVHDAYPQSGFGNNEDGKSARKERVSARGGAVSGAKKQFCDQRREHAYGSADKVEAYDANLASEFRSSGDNAYATCMRGGDWHKAYSTALFGGSNTHRTRHSPSTQDRGQCGSTQHMCGGDCCPD